jgi:hypothetical protein
MSKEPTFIGIGDEATEGAHIRVEVVADPKQDTPEHENPTFPQPVLNSS